MLPKPLFHLQLSEDEFTTPVSVGEVGVAAVEGCGDASVGGTAVVTDFFCKTVLLIGALSLITDVWPMQFSVIASKIDFFDFVSPHHATPELMPTMANPMAEAVIKPDQYWD